MSDQIFGYTPPEREEGEDLVRYLAAHKAGGGDVKITVRNGAGEHNEIVIPAAEVENFSIALTRAW